MIKVLHSKQLFLIRNENKIYKSKKCFLKIQRKKNWYGVGWDISTCCYSWMYDIPIVHYFIDFGEMVNNYIQITILSGAQFI